MGPDCHVVLYCRRQTGVRTGDGTERDDQVTHTVWAVTPRRHKTSRDGHVYLASVCGHRRGWPPVYAWHPFLRAVMGGAYVLRVQSFFEALALVHRLRPE